MRSPVPDSLTEALACVAPDTSGAVAQDIPQLATAHPDRLAAAFATVDGEVYDAGGFDAVLAEVGVEPSGEACDEPSEVP